MFIASCSDLGSSGLFLATGGGFLDALPDPMRPDLKEVTFVMVVVTLLFWVLKATFFKPVLQVMDDREGRIQAGTTKRAEALALVEQRQAEYQARMAQLRTQAFEHKKRLAESASSERQKLLESTRAQVVEDRRVALERLEGQSATAKEDLVRQVDELAESMVNALLKA